jgi:predicted ATPase/DNA-binding SARP family transcriptional activator
VDYRVLGPLEAVSEEGEPVRLGGSRQRAVLACLLTRHNQVVSTDRLIEATWGDDPPSSPKSALQTYVSRLRKALGDGAIRAKAPGYVLRLGPDELDAAVFERLVDDGRRAAELKNLAAAVERFDAALELWNGEAYADFAYADFARGEAERLEELRRTVIEDRFAALLEQGKHREAVPGLERALDDQPLRERLWGLAMIALYRDGRQAAALRAYRRAADLLGEQLGVEPGAELREIEERILLQDPELATPSTAPRSGLPEGEVTFLVGAGAAESSAAWETFRRGAELHGGHVVESAATQRMAVFPTTSQALYASIDIMRQAPRDADPPSMGIHATEAAIRRGGYVGNGVSRATRIATIANPGQVLLSAAAARAASPLDEVTRLTRLDDIAIPGMSSTESVYVVGHPELGPAHERPAASRTNLSAGGLTSFIGRDAEIQEVRTLTTGHRLVTLAGPGGVGKTRLAYQVAADLVGRYAGGVWLIELAGLEPELIMPTVLSTLGIEAFRGESAAEAIGRHADRAPVLLVLDNCEHLIDAAAEAASQLLRASRHVGMLATSRERLGLPGEQVFQVSGLATPPAGDALDIEVLTRSDAVALFVERAQGVRAGFALDLSAAGAVATLCRRLDGIPLALELAASRLDVLTPREIAARLDDRFRLLVTRARGIPARQRTLEAVLDWSYELLSPTEQLLLRRLAVFHGPFDLQAAEDICSGDALAGDEVLDTLGGLVAKSLVTSRVDAEATSYTLLETVHAYAGQLLRQSEEAASLAERHADHYRALARGWAENEPPVVNPWWKRLVAQVDNVRFALEWFADHRAVDDMLALVGDLQWFWVFRSMSTEGLAWTRRALATPETPHDLRIRLLRAAGPLAAEERRYAEAERWTRESLEHWQRAGRPVDAASDLNNLAVMARMQGRLEEALELVEASIANIEGARSRAYRDLHKLAGSYISRAEILCELGRLEAAETAVRRAGQIEADIDTDSYLHHDALRVMGRITLADGRIDEATEWFHQAEVVGDDLGSDYTTRAKNGLAAVALVRGDLDSARMLLRDALQLVDPTATDRLESLRLLGLALLLAGETEAATDAAHEMVTRSAGGGGERWLAEALEVAGLCAAAMGDADQSATLLRSAHHALRSAGIVNPAWHLALVEQIAERYELDLGALGAPSGDREPLSTGEAGRLALAAR